MIRIYTLFYRVALRGRCLVLNAVPALVALYNTKAKNERRRSHDKSSLAIGKSTSRKH